MHVTSRSLWSGYHSVAVGRRLHCETRVATRRSSATLEFSHKREDIHVTWSVARHTESETNIHAIFFFFIIPTTKVMEAVLVLFWDRYLHHRLFLGRCLVDTNSIPVHSGMLTAQFSFCPSAVPWRTVLAVGSCYTAGPLELPFPQWFPHKRLIGSHSQPTSPGCQPFMHLLRNEQCICSIESCKKIEI